MLLISFAISSSLLIVSNKSRSPFAPCLGDLIYIHNSNCLLLLCVYCIRFDGVGMDVVSRIVAVE